MLIKLKGLNFSLIYVKRCVFTIYRSYNFLSHFIEAMKIQGPDNFMFKWNLKSTY